MNPVQCTQVTQHAKAHFPDKTHIMERLQSSKYFKVVEVSGTPDHFLLDVQAIVMPHQLPYVTDLLASIRAPDNNTHPVCHQPPSSSIYFPNQLQASQPKVHPQV